MILCVLLLSGRFRARSTLEGHRAHGLAKGEPPGPSPGPPPGPAKGAPWARQQHRNLQGVSCGGSHHLDSVWTCIPFSAFDSWGTYRLLTHFPGLPIGIPFSMIWNGMQNHRKGVSPWGRPTQSGTRAARISDCNGLPHRDTPFRDPYSERRKFPLLGRPSPLCQVKDGRLGEPEISGGIWLVEASKGVLFCFLPY